MWLMKSGVLPALAAGVLVSVLAGCASTAAPESTLAKDEGCRVTGSNLPRRECRDDVTVLPPSALEKVGATPASGKSN